MDENLEKGKTMAPESFELDYEEFMEDEAVARELIADLERWIEEPDDTDPDGEIEKTADECASLYQSLLEAYEAEENDIVNLLTEDDYLLEEFTDKLSFVSFVEHTLEGTNRESLEAAYCTLFDTSFELAKIIHPLGGFGKDRLITGVDMVDSFEDEYWPLYVKLTDENAEAFREMIPPTLFAQVLSGEKQALGALRFKARHVYAAGAAVFEKAEDPVSGEAFFALSWIYVPGQFRQEGVGNFLMAQLCAAALREKAAYLDVRIPVLSYEDETEEKAFAILENFLDSWGFRFVITPVGTDPSAASASGSDMIRLCYHGMLKVPFPSQTVTNTEWAELRKAAGLSDDKLPDESRRAKTGSANKLDALEKLLTVREKYAGSEV